VIAGILKDHSHTVVNAGLSAFNVFGPTHISTNCDSNTLVN